ARPLTCAQLGTCGRRPQSGSRALPPVAARVRTAAIPGPVTGAATRRQARGVLLTKTDKPDAPAVPHFHGHRERLRARFLAGGSAALADYELLELVLFRALPRRDVKPLAKALLDKFGSFPEVIAAPPQRLAEVRGLGDAAITELKVVQAAAERLARDQVRSRPLLSSWSALIDYCRAAMAFADKEQFRILFLDKRNRLIADERQQVGTVD